MRLLLLSGSRTPGQPFLHHALDAIAWLLGPRRRLLVVPFALADHERYTRQVTGSLAPLGVQVTGAHEIPGPRRLLRQAEAVFVGGGNTFRLLRDLRRTGLLDPIREAVRAGRPYLGSSAGTNLACPTVRTTNDMPIVEPQSLAALGLVPFQINPHFLDPDPTSTHQGETREERITQFLEENDVPVLGLREGTWLTCADHHLLLGGAATGARLFTRGRHPGEVKTGSDLSHLLADTPLFDHPAQLPAPVDVDIGTPPDA
jgi:dipeptidase E